MKRRCFSAAILCFSVLAFAFGGGQKNAPSGNLTIEVGGSTSVSPLMELLADEYQKSNPGIRININGTGSSDGIKNAGVMYQIGMSSRELTPAEQGQGLKEVIIAIDGIAVIVHNSNPLSGLTVDQIRDIFTGAITDWSQITGGAKQGRIAIVSREEGSGTRSAFEEIIGMTDNLVRGAGEFTSTGAIKAGIAQNPDAIGYISLGSVDNTVKAIAIDTVAATNANVVNGSYKIARPFILLTGSNVHSESTIFADWILSPAGQDIVRISYIAIK